MASILICAVALVQTCNPSTVPSPSFPQGDQHFCEGLSLQEGSGRGATNAGQPFSVLCNFCTNPPPHPPRAMLQAMSNAYEASLASIHPWILKKSLMAAFKIAPTREAFFQQLAPSDEVALACMRRFITANRPIVQSVTDTFEKFNLKWTF